MLSLLLLPEFLGMEMPRDEDLPDRSAAVFSERAMTRSKSAA